MFWFFAIPLLIIGGVCVIALLILSYYEIQEAMKRYREEKREEKRYREEKNKKAVAARINKKLKVGDYYVAEVGLLDSGNNEIEKVELRAEEDANDYYVGQRIPLTC